MIASALVTAASFARVRLTISDSEAISLLQPNDAIEHARTRRFSTISDSVPGKPRSNSARLSRPLRKRRRDAHRFSMVAKSLNMCLSPLARRGSIRDGKSRISREVHVRICEAARGEIPGADSAGAAFATKFCSMIGVSGTHRKTQVGPNSTLRSARMTIKFRWNANRSSAPKPMRWGGYTSA
jgi:hypothetical protein